MEPIRDPLAETPMAGTATSPIDPDTGRFAGRCAVAIDRCRSAMPALRAVAPDQGAARRLTGPGGRDIPAGATA